MGSIAARETGLDINGAMGVRVVRVVLALLAMGMRMRRIAALGMVVGVRVGVAVVAMIVAVVLMQEGGAQNVEGEADAAHNQDQFGVLDA